MWLYVPGMSPLGATSLTDDPTSRPRLNPAFVDLLMGWPVGHTSLLTWCNG